MSDGLQGWNQIYTTVQWEIRFHLLPVVQEPVGWELGCLCINAPSYFSYFKPSTWA